MSKGIPLLFLMILIVGIMEDEILKKLGNRIREVRLQKKLSQVELASQCGCNRNYISMLERGERNPSYKSLMMIANGLGVKIQKIVTE